MRQLLMSFMLLLALLSAGLQPAHAAEDELTEAEEAALREELEKARANLSEAARQVAELSSQLHSERERMVFEFAGAPRRNRAMLGIAIGPGEEDSAVDGVQVISVTPGGPADKAGIRSGDVLIRIGDKGLAEGGDAAMKRLTEYLAEREPGDEVTVEYLRGEDRRTATIKTESMGRNMFFSHVPGLAGEEFAMHLRGLADPPALPEMPRGLPRVPHAPFVLELMHRMGDMELATLTPSLGKYFGTEEGLLVVRAPKDGAYRLKDGDVILEIDGRKPSDPGHAIRILSSYEGGETLEIEIMRDRQRQVLEIQVPERKVGLRRIDEGRDKQKVVVEKATSAT